jgi:hypothetical protein
MDAPPFSAPIAAFHLPTVSGPLAVMEHGMGGRPVHPRFHAGPIAPSWYCKFNLTN